MRIAAIVCLCATFFTLTFAIGSVVTSAPAEAGHKCYARC
jgi:hypothetical protein